MNTTKKSIVTATVAATALAGFGVTLAPSASASAAANKNFSKAFSQTCTVGILGSQTLGAVVSGTVPSTVAHGAAFKLTNGKIKVTIPSSTNSAAFSVGARSQQTTFTVINLNNVNITPKTVDAAKTDLVAKKTPVPASGATSITVPTAGGVTVALKAGAKGTGTIKAGSVTAKTQLFNSTGAPLGPPQDVACGATNTVLTTVAIS